MEQNEKKEENKPKKLVKNFNNTNNENTASLPAPKSGQPKKKTQKTNSGAKQKKPVNSAKKSTGGKSAKNSGSTENGSKSTTYTPYQGKYAVEETPKKFVRTTYDTYKGKYAVDGDGQTSDEDSGKLPKLKPSSGQIKRKKPVVKSPQEQAKERQDEKIKKQKESAKRRRVREAKQKEKRQRDLLVKLFAIASALIIVALLILNMPIIFDKKSSGTVSIINYVKNWQPLVSVEGELEENKMDLKVNSGELLGGAVYSDGLDLPQLVEGQYTVLVLGFDEDEFNTDVIWVCEFDIGKSELNILQIPRDTCLPNYTDNVTGKFNSIYASGNPKVKPIQRVVDAVQENFGIPVDAYITTGCGDIVSMVDLVGGIPITIENEIMYEADKIIPQGYSVLSGQQAEWFVRFRWQLAEGDIGRMKNQRIFMAAAMQKLLSIVRDEGRTKLYGYMKDIYENEYIYTNMSLGDISKLADFASTLSMDKVKVNMVPGEGAYYEADDGMEYDVYSVHKKACIDMLNEYYRPYQHKLKMSDSAITEFVRNPTDTTYDDTGNTLGEISEGEAPGGGIALKEMN